MGNSLQQYRCQIGTFINNRSGMTIKKCKHETVRNNSRFFFFNPAFILLFSVVSILTTPEISNSFQLPHSNIPAGWSNIFLQKSVEIIDNNFQSRYKHGNRQKNGLKIMHWNACGKHLINKIGNIESVINGYRPHFLGISEANLLKKHDITDVQIENYTLYVSNTLSNPSIEASRVVVFVHNDVICKVRHDLMNDKFSSIWLEVHLPRQKKFLVCHAYRDWQYMKQGNNDSKYIDAQLTRWIQFLDQWETAMKTDLECIVLGLEY
jgi:hypothetical protein